MVQRRIADLWRQAAADVPATVNWAAMYKTLLGELVALSAQGAVPDAELRARLEALITETQKRKPPSRASLVREGLIDGIRGWGSNGTESALKLSRCPANPCNVWIVSKNDRFMKPFPLSRGKVTNTRKSVQ